MAQLLPTHIFSARLLAFALGTVMVPCAAHEGEASAVFDVVASKRFEQRGDGIDSHVVQLTTLDEFRVQVGQSNLPVVIQFSDDSARVWGGTRELYQNLAGDFVGKVLFVSVNAKEADVVVKRFMGLFLQLTLQAQAKTDSYNTALRKRLALLLSQLAALRNGEGSRVHLFFKDGHLIIPQTERYDQIDVLRRDVRSQLLVSRQAQVLKAPSPWQHATVEVATLGNVNLRHHGDVRALAKRLRVHQICSNN